METISAVQGTPEWLQHRKPPMRNASESPNVMGEGYVSRSAFMRQWATGIEREIDPATQKRFDKGHRLEALARPLMNALVGQDLYPIVGVDGKYSASFDGLSAGDDVGAEHKQLNATIRACKSAADLPLLYRIQLEVQCRVSGAEKILFLATDWDENDNLREEVHFWYEPDLKLRADIDAAWNQFEIDAATYCVPPEVLPPVVATPTQALPAVSIQVGGMLSLTTNLDRFLIEATAFIATIPVKPASEQEFADCRAAIKELQKSQNMLDAAEAGAIAQISAFDLMKRTKALCFDLVRKARLATEKDVEREDKRIKDDLVRAGRDAFVDHIAMLNARLGKPYMPLVQADFPGAIKGLSKLESLKDAVDGELARAKIEANSIAARIEINLEMIGDNSVYTFLFADAAQIALKQPDDFALLVKSRIDAHIAAEVKNLADMREKIRAEERAKAEAKAAEAAKIEPVVAQTSTSASRGADSPSGATSVATAATYASGQPQALVNGNTPDPIGVARLRGLIASSLIDLSAGELQQALDAIREIKAARCGALTLGE